MNGCDVVVFLGPSLPSGRAQVLLPDGTFLPPARQGDIYRAARDRRPHAIGLIDGTFATVPAVWHREILWSLAEAGIPVLGAASMGALRAAELHVFGMQGVGKIYESYRDGYYAPFTDPFEDDDEVAVRHGPPEAGCIPVSDAMVDLRETLFAAETARIVTRDARDALAQAMKRLHFSERSLTHLCALAEAVAGTDGAALVTWLRAGNAVSQKRRDAEALLRLLSADIQPQVPPTFEFERAQVWERFRAKADAADGTGPARAVAE
jgi:hypothetical protein